MVAHIVFYYQTLKQIWIFREILSAWTKDIGDLDKLYVMLEHTSN